MLDPGLLSWLGWTREFLLPQAAGGAGAPSVVRVTPHAEITVAAGCNASACFVCELRAVIEQALKRDLRLAEELRHDAEEREKQKEKKAKAAKKGSVPMPRASEAPAVAQPFDLTILGLRRLNSISDAFDDRMVVFCRLPNGSEAKEISDAAASLLDPLETAAREAKSSVRVVTCSGAPWLAALFTITTDVGLVTRRRDVEQSLQKTNDEITDNQQKLDKARQRQKQVDQTELSQAKTKLDEANKALKSAESEKKKAKDQLDQELKKSKKNRDEIKQLMNDLDKKRGAEKEKKNAVAELTRQVGRLTRESALLAKKVAALEKTGQALDKQKTTREKEVAKRTAELDQKKVHISEGQEGWVEEGRALMLPGHYRDTYSYFIHHSGGDGFWRDTSLTALTVGYIHGLRVYSKRYLCANPGEFVDKEIRVGELKSSSGTRKFLTEKATLVVDAKGASASVLVSTGEQIALKDDDIVLLQMQIGGTNLHRAHNATLASDGTLHGDSMTKVHDWSWGCQTFPDYKEFNLFLRLCAVAKRWQCASSFHVKEGPDCAVLQAGSGDARGPGEQAIVHRFGEEFVGHAGDLNRSKKDPEVEKKLGRINELTFSQEDQKKLDELQKLKARRKAKNQELNQKDEQLLEDLEAKQSRELTKDEQSELAGLLQDQQKWRREYLREKTKRLAADHLRLCDVRSKCAVRFSYTLVEVTAEEVARIEIAFHDSLNKEWNGKLV